MKEPISLRHEVTALDMYPESAKADRVRHSQSILGCLLIEKLLRRKDASLVNVTYTESLERDVLGTKCATSITIYDSETPWYLLYGGTSEDGMGPGRYEGRTCKEELARAFHEKLRADAYSTGYVLVVYPDRTQAIYRHRMWDDYFPLRPKNSN